MASPPKKLEKLIADRHTPWLGVHVITEFMFCPRAGLIAYELGQDDDDEYYEEQRIQLDYLPFYDLIEIEKRLDWIAEELRTLMYKRKQSISIQQHAEVNRNKSALIYLGISLLFSLIILVLGFGFFYSFLTLLLFYFFSGLFIPKVGYYSHYYSEISFLEDKSATLRARLEAARSAVPQLPKESTHNEWVDWWSLLAAGFDSCALQDPLRDPAYKIAGRPWRVLRRGHLCIPVWRMRKGTITNGRLKAQHYARMGAYCRLIEKSIGAKSPYGIVLLGAETYEGITVSKEQGSRAAFHRGLKEARRVVIAAQRGYHPSAPHPRSCLNCPSGKPFVYNSGISDARTGRLNSPVNLHESNLDRRFYHSECGDRFCWLPPHQKASDKYLN